MNRNEIVRREIVTPGGLHIRSAAGGEESRTISGYSILFNVPSAPLYEDDEEVMREVIAPEAVTEELLRSSDIKMLLFHDRKLILARSVNGEGNLTYFIDDKGVGFNFEAPHTVDGDKALELVRNGVLTGCSFAFSTKYYDPDWVERKHETDADNKLSTTCVVRHISGIYDFSIVADPAYPDTSVEARELAERLRGEAPRVAADRSKQQVAEMRERAKNRII
jgi:hypothetical protein